MDNIVIAGALVFCGLVWIVLCLFSRNNKAVSLFGVGFIILGFMLLSSW